MKLSNKIKIYLIAFALILIFTLLLNYFNVKKVLSLNAESILEQKKEVVVTTINLKSSPIENFVDDYTFWDDMIDFVEKPDSEFAELNIDATADVFKANYCWVYSLKESLVYYYSSEGNRKIDLREMHVPDLESIFRKNSLEHFFYFHNNQLIEIFGGTLHPSTDEARQTVPKGYFFAGKVWDSSYIEELGRISHCRINVFRTFEEAEAKRLLSKDSSFVIKLQNGFNEQIPAYVFASSDFPFIKRLSNQTTSNLIWMGVIFLLFTIFSILLFSFLIIRPVNIISESLENNRGDLLPDNITRKDEFAKLYMLLKEFFIQNEKLHESRELYRKLVEISPDAIFLVGLDSKILFSNNQALALFGKSSIDELKGLSLDSQIFSDRVVLQKGIVANTLRNRYFQSSDYYIKTNGNNFILIEISSSLITNPDGSPNSIICEIRDITERKKTEADLIEARNKALESDQLKTAFLNNLSHEVRTPMNAIIGFANLLKEFSNDKETSEIYINQILHSGDILLVLIDDILDMAKLEAGQLSVKKTEFDLKNFLHDQFLTMESLKFKLDKGHIQIHMKIPINENTIVFTDQLRLGQIFRNLLNNALKYTEKGSIEFGVIMKGNLAEFYVKDTGLGISQSKFEYIFERFKQLDSGASRKYGGLGLGLSITKDLVILLGGQIWLSSEENSGSTFYFTIPIK